jgi:hypothetical protein
MVKVPEKEAELTMVVIHAKNQPDGFYFAMVPTSLNAAQVDSALLELGIEGQQIFELGGWRYSSQNVCVAYVPFPTSDSAQRKLWEE